MGSSWESWVYIGVDTRFAAKLPSLFKLCSHTFNENKARAYIG